MAKKEHHKPLGLTLSQKQKSGQKEGAHGVQHECPPQGGQHVDSVMYLEKEEANLGAEAAAEPHQRLS